MTTRSYQIAKLFSEETRREAASIDWNHCRGRVLLSATPIGKTYSVVQACALGYCLLREFGGTDLGSELWSEFAVAIPQSEQEVGQAILEAAAEGLTSMPTSLQLHALERSGVAFFKAFDRKATRAALEPGEVARMLGLSED